jgi:hypothetical protein
MHFLKAAFITAGFFAGFVLGKDIAVSILARAAAPGATTQAAA